MGATIRIVCVQKSKMAVNGIQADHQGSLLGSDSVAEPVSKMTSHLLIRPFFRTAKMLFRNGRNYYNQMGGLEQARNLLLTLTG